MRVTEITVAGLFGIFDHVVPMNISKRVTIIFGPNGFGKTYTLRLVDALLNGRIELFSDIPFNSISVSFDDGSILVASRNENNSITFSLSEEGKGAEDITFEKLKRVISAVIPVRLINTQRLMQFSDVVEDRRTINDYSEDLKKHIKEDGSARKLDLLLSIVNGRFTHKELKITEEKGFTVETASGTILRPDQLSSGEQHLIVLLYDLLFTVRQNSLILIDEPELSLHVFWQQQFIADLLKIIQLVSIDILIATHSPQIIHDRWDLAVELKGSKE